MEKLANFKVDLCLKIDQVLIELKKLKKGTVMNYANSRLVNELLFLDQVLLKLK